MYRTVGHIDVIRSFTQISLSVYIHFKNQVIRSQALICFVKYNVNKKAGFPSQCEGLREIDLRQLDLVTPYLVF